MKNVTPSDDQSLLEERILPSSKGHYMLDETYVDEMAHLLEVGICDSKDTLRRTHLNEHCSKSCTSSFMKLQQNAILRTEPILALMKSRNPES